MPINNNEKLQDTQAAAGVTNLDANVQAAAGTQNVTRQEENDEVIPDKSDKLAQDDEDEGLRISKEGGVQPQDVTRQEVNGEVLRDENGKLLQANKGEELPGKGDEEPIERGHEGLPGQKVEGQPEEDDKGISGQKMKTM